MKFVVIYILSILTSISAYAVQGRIIIGNECFNENDIVQFGNIPTPEGHPPIAIFVLSDLEIAFTFTGNLTNCVQEAQIAYSYDDFVVMDWYHYLDECPFDYDADPQDPRMADLLRRGIPSPWSTWRDGFMAGLLFFALIFAAVFVYGACRRAFEVGGINE